MSNISNRHNVNLFVAGKSQALSGQRLAKVGYKSSKNAPAQYPSICVSVPHINPMDIENNVQALLPYIADMIESVQEKIIKSLYESSNGQLKSVGDEDISVQSCIRFMEAEKNGGRLTGDMIGQWFKGSMHDNLYVILAEKLGFNDPSEAQEAQIEKVLNGYKGLVVSLAGGKTLLTEIQRESIKKAIELCGLVEDDIGARLLNRIENMSKEKSAEEFLAL